ncbi:hypothetical protein CLV24_12037 [Pontibacter ummariensis]|uniref:Uncharacterized protein n=1 Tax=Pontibacter ummariensis TaxID=1610492 RepID=A0A239J567_9BACT|nr:hypothetical protein CLV24_12037 [Pontibacter ummariensis]SNT00628.1 hypothetical protein SAMN06296052_12036 [Pontibacter ummariensis]
MSLKNNSHSNENPVVISVYYWVFIFKANYFKHKLKL